MNKDEALKKCLRVLEPIAEQRMYEAQWVVSAILACKEALEQPTQEWQGLSDEEKHELYLNTGGTHFKDIYQAIEQKLKEKNK